MTVFFYEETLGVLEKHGHKPEEVKYVFNKDFCCSWGRLLQACDTPLS